MPLYCCTSVSGECVELTEKEYKVCCIVYRGLRSNIKFSELKKESSLHQEVLSRILHRLIVHELIKKTNGGYAASK